MLSALGASELMSKRERIDTRWVHEGRVPIVIGIGQLAVWFDGAVIRISVLYRRHRSPPALRV